MVGQLQIKANMVVVGVEQKGLLPPGHLKKRMKKQSRFQPQERAITIVLIGEMARL